MSMHKRAAELADALPAFQIENAFVRAWVKEAYSMLRALAAQEPGPVEEQIDYWRRKAEHQEHRADIEQRSAELFGKRAAQLHAILERVEVAMSAAEWANIPGRWRDVYAEVQAALAAPPQAAAQPDDDEPGYWVMDVAGVLVTLDEWEPGARKVKDRRAAQPQDERGAYERCEQCIDKPTCDSASACLISLGYEVANRRAALGAKDGR